MNQLHQKFLISSVVALRAWRETILSLNSKTYKIGMDAWQNPTLKKTGNSSPDLEISYSFELLSSNASSNQIRDLMPRLCNSVIERNEWSNFISIVYKIYKPEECVFPRKIHIGAINLDPFYESDAISNPVDAQRYNKIIFVYKYHA